MENISTKNGRSTSWNILMFDRSKNEKQEYYNVRTVLKSNQKNHRNRSKIDTTNIHVHDFYLAWLGTGTSIKK